MSRRSGDTSAASAARFLGLRHEGSTIEWPDAKLRRDENRARGACINDTRAQTHGPATNGVRCADCAEKHKRSR